MVKLGVNIDHIATIREARKINEPDPIWGAALAELGGADGITIHLREDRRHINDRDLKILRETVKTRLNLEMALTPGIIEIALDTKPDMITIVPEKREEITTEGGLDVIGNKEAIIKATEKFNSLGIQVSLFIDPDNEQIRESSRCGVEFIELHTGKYADAIGEKNQKSELELLIKSARFAKTMGLRINAGHGLNYRNVKNMLQIPDLEELNIGHSIIARSVFTGLKEAVEDMKKLITE